MITKAKKQDIVKNLEDQFERQKVVIFTDYRGINVSKVTNMRRELRKLGAEFKIAKKTFLRIALKKIGVDYDPKELDGQVGVVFGFEDQVAPARALAKFAKENKTFKILKGILGGKLYEGKGMADLAKLPAREQLLAMVVGTLNAPIQGLHTILQGNMRNLAVVLHRISQAKQ